MKNNPTFDERALMEDLIRLKILDLVQFISIRPSLEGPLTPYQQTLADLAAKYAVPSPYDRFEKID